MSVIAPIRKTYTFFRWTWKPTRYLGRRLRLLAGATNVTVANRWQPVSDNPLYEDFCRNGYAALRDHPFRLPEIDLASLAGTARESTFFNALPANWELLKPLITEVLAERRFVDCLLRYFDGLPWFWNVALNYSEAGNSLRESQLWHFDYGDVKQLHAMLYFSDVDMDCGPFTFFPASTSNKVPRSRWVIERLNDADLERVAGISLEERVCLTGKRGDFFIADPGRVLHQGARCNRPRLVMFLTFTTRAPMSRGGSKTLRRDQRVDLYKYYSETQGREAIFTKEFFL
jgi:hypothetical protein